MSSPVNTGVAMRRGIILFVVIEAALLAFVIRSVLAHG